MIFDTHAHFYGEALFRHLAARSDVPRVETTSGRRFMVTPTSRFTAAALRVKLGGRGAVLGDVRGYVRADARHSRLSAT